jgi:hypothetical protein
VTREYASGGGPSLPQRLPLISPAQFALGPSDKSFVSRDSRSPTDGTSATYVEATNRVIKSGAPSLCTPLSSSQC